MISSAPFSVFVNLLHSLVSPVVVHIVDESPPVLVLPEEDGVAHHHKQAHGAGKGNVEPRKNRSVTRVWWC